MNDCPHCAESRRCELEAHQTLRLMEARVTALLEANTKLVGALDMVREGLWGSNVQDLCLIVNTALAVNRKTIA